MSGDDEDDEENEHCNQNAGDEHEKEGLDDTVLEGTFYRKGRTVR